MIQVILWVVGLIVLFVFMISNIEDPGKFTCSERRIYVNDPSTGLKGWVSDGLNCVSTETPPKYRIVK